MKKATSLCIYFAGFLLLWHAPTTHAQQRGADDSASYFLLKPDRVFDGEQMHHDWVVLVKGNRIAEAGRQTFTIPAGTRTIDLKGHTLLPGLIEGHSHLFLHPYDEAPFEEQIMKETRAERVARAVQHAAATLMAGFTTVRDLGTEGAGYDDIGLKQAIRKGVVPGPRIMASGRALAAIGAYAVRSSNPDVTLPKGVAEVSNVEEMAREVRIEIGKGVNVIKLYGDQFTTEEIKQATWIAQNSYRTVAVHAFTAEAMDRAIEAGVNSIEHGDAGTAEIFTRMREKEIAYYPTIAAAEAMAGYQGWRKGIDPEPAGITTLKKAFKAALASGVTIGSGSDVGVFAHGENARELELMVGYGMPALDVLKAATSVNAKVLGYYGSRLGRVQKGMYADLIAVEGNPSEDIRNIRKLGLIMKNGVVYKDLK